MNEIDGTRQIKDYSIPPNKLIGGGGSTALSGLTDVSIVNLLDKDLLQYNGSTWENIAVTDLIFDYIDFDTTYSGAMQEGRVAWDTDDGTVQVGMPGGNVNLQLGQEQLARVTNKQGSDITNGLAVYMNGATGNTPTVKLPDLQNRYQTFATVGVATENITNNHKGYINTFGYVRDINTSSFPEGTELFLGDNGVLTSGLPTKPDRTVWMGIVTNQHSTEGSVWIKPVPLPMLDELSDVVISNPVNNNYLVYSSGLWINSSGILNIASGKSFTITDNITISGGGSINLGGYNLTILSSGTAILGSIAANQVAYGSGANTIAGSAKLTYNGTTVSINDGNSIAAALVTTDYLIASAQNLSVGVSVLTAGDTADRRGVFKGTRARGTLASPSAPSSGDDVLTFLGAIYDGTTTQGTAGVFFVVDGSVSPNTAPQRIGFYTGTTNAASRTERLTVKSDGKIGISKTAPTARLDVLGITDIQQFLVTGHTTQAVATALAQFTRNDSAAGISVMLGLTALGSGAAGDGGSIDLNGKSSTTAAQSMGLINWQWVTATHATRKSKLGFSAYDTAVRLGLEIEATGSGVTLKSFGPHTSTGRKRAIRVVTSDYTLTALDEVVISTATSGITLQLPTAIGSGTVFSIKSANTGFITISGNSQFIDGSSSQTIYSYESITVTDYLSNNWAII